MQRVVQAEAQRNKDASAAPVTVVVVTKHQAEADIAALIALGYRHLAENRVADLLARQAAFPQAGLIWHLIGTLQTRKVKQVINAIDCFHALDRLRLAQAIQQHRQQPLPCFVQVNIFNEDSKHGLAVDEVAPFVAHLAEYDRIHVVGLMTMAPLGATSQQLQEGFAALATLQQTIARQQWAHAPCQQLSMGMSQDFEEAIRAGATHVRIGSAFFND